MLAGLNLGWMIMSSGLLAPLVSCANLIVGLCFMSFLITMVIDSF